MLPSLPTELLDLIVDHTWDEPTTLESCCLVSKSWIPRTRRYIFAHVEFHSNESNVHSLESWMETFPDPFSSPAHHTRSLVISGLTAVTAVTTHGLAWARSFHSITTLTVDTHWWDDGEVSLSRLHGLSPTLTSLFVHRSSLPLSEAFNLTCSFPLLEDLSLCSFFPKRRHLTDEKNVPPTSPKLTGSLLLKGDTISMTRRLLNLPGGLRFSKITMGCSDAYLELVVDLVWRCSDTLESLCLDHFSSGKPGVSPFDLSKATKLKKVELRWHRSSVQWITMSLQTAKSPNLRQITITIDSLATFVNPVGEAILREWQDLDHLLVQLWTSRSILPKIRHEKKGCGNDLGVLATSLLPELTRRGAVSIVG